MSDLISRQAVLDLLDDAKKQGIKQITIPYFKCLVENLPPTTPQPKMGMWIEHFDESGKWYECAIDIVKEDFDRIFEPQEINDKCKKCEYYRNPDYTRCHECKAESER